MEFPANGAEFDSVAWPSGKDQIRGDYFRSKANEAGRRFSKCQMRWQGHERRFRESYFVHISCYWQWTDCLCRDQLYSA